MTDTKKDKRHMLNMRLTPKQEEIVGRLIAEQHERMKSAGGTLMAPPTVPDVVRFLIDREGERLDREHAAITAPAAESDGAALSSPPEGGPS